MHSLLSHKTALLIFARSSKEEVAHKTIYNGTQLFDSLTSHVLEIASKTELPYFHFSEEKQIGNTFGERFTNAIKEIFKKGYEQIITIGNDTPQLNASYILEAEKQLRSNKSVLGPSVDGGFYLLGIHKSQFDPRTFQQLAWQTSDLSRQLLKLINQGGSTIFQLPTLYDIDAEADLKSIISYACHFSEALLTAILNSIDLQKSEHYIPLQRIHSLALTINYNKGSPIFTSLQLLPF